MRAKVKDNARWRTVVAMQGREFTKNEWRLVPPGFEDEALGNPFLDVDEGMDAPSADVLPDQVPAEEVKEVEVVTEEPSAPAVEETKDSRPTRNRSRKE